MKRKPFRVDAKDWTEGGYPLNTIHLSRSATVLIFCALGFTAAICLLLFGLAFDRMAVPWSRAPRIVSMDDPGRFWSSAAAWLLLAIVFRRATLWALSRVRRDWQHALQLRKLHDRRAEASKADLSR